MWVNGDAVIVAEYTRVESLDGASAQLTELNDRDQRVVGVGVQLQLAVLSELTTDPSPSSATYTLHTVGLWPSNRRLPE